MEPLTAIPDEKAMEELEEAKVALEIAKKQAPDESKASERDKLIEEIDDLKKYKQDIINLENPEHDKNQEILNTLENNVLNNEWATYDETNLTNSTFASTLKDSSLQKPALSNTINEIESNVQNAKQNGKDNNDLTNQG